MVERLLCLRQQFLKVKMSEDKRLEMDFGIFFWRKDVVVGELYLAFKLLAAAFGIKLEAVLRHSMGLVLVFVTETMEASLCSIAKATRQMMVLGAIVELYVPTHRDEEHHKGHQQGSDMQDLVFHAAKL